MMSPARIRAVGQALARLDSQTSDALVAHAGWVVDASDTLREAAIILATPPLQDSRAAAGLRDRIDQLLGIVPRPHAEAAESERVRAQAMRAGAEDRL